MSEDEKEIEQSNEIINLVEKFLKFNNQNQERLGLKIPTSDQMLSRWTISLAQLKAAKNLEKVKSEIRQPLYSVYS